MKSGAPLVPVGLVGTDTVQAPGERFPHPFRAVTVRFGPPIDVCADPAAHRRTTLRVASDSLMRAIAGLSGQTYVDSFADSSAA